MSDKREISAEAAAHATLLLAVSWARALLTFTIISAASLLAPVAGASEVHPPARPVLLLSSVNR